MKKVLGILVLAMMFLLPMVAVADSLTIKWDAVTGATGYQVYQSVDQGVTWTQATGGTITSGTTVTANLTAVPATGLVLFRVGAKNAQGETLRTNAGAFYRGDWSLPAQTTGLGIQ